MRKMNKWIGMLLIMVVCCSFYTTARGEELEETGEISILTYNIAGLPSIISGGNPSVNTTKIGELLNQFDLVGVQEDFHYHSDLIATATDFPYQTKTKGTIPFGDGVNVLSKYPMFRETRVPWRETYGFISNGADEMIPKGFVFQRIQVEPGAFIDVYNLHCDAGREEGSTAARIDNLNQLAEMINLYSEGNAVIVMGDFNARYFREEDKVYELLIEPTGLIDIWVELIRDGDYPEPDAEHLEFILTHIDDPNVDKDGPDHEEVDKILYRSGNHVDLQATDFRIEEELFVDSQGGKLSDHYAFSAKIQYTTHVTKTNKVYLSDMQPIAYENGWGPVEYDVSNGETKPRDGAVMRIGGKNYAKGLGVHAPSYLEYDLNSAFTYFRCDIGIDDEMNGGSIRFKVIGDDTVLYESGHVFSNHGPIPVNVNVEGVDRLKLIVTDGGNGNKDDHADWADAHLLRHEDDEVVTMVNDTDPHIQYNGNFSYHTGRHND